MIIGVSGYGATGASAVIALIMECGGIQSYEYGTEFQILQEPDGILDLQNYIVNDQRRLSSHFVIRRFLNNINSFGGRDLRRETKDFFEDLCNEYIKSLISVEWNGKSGFDTPDVAGFLYKNEFKYINKIISRVGRTFNPMFIWPPCYKKYYACMDEGQFVDVTKQFIEQILLLSKFDLSRRILLEQVFPPNAPTRGMEFFDDCRSIVVERDPRDLYILTNCLMSHKSLFMPCNGDVDGFIKYFKGLHKYHDKDDKVKYVQYEDFIYDYDNTKNRLLEWLGLEMEKERTLFVPEKSINNTQLFHNYPDLSNDIKKIENKLPEFIYPFQDKKLDMRSKPDIRKAFVIKPGDTKTRKRKY